MTEETEIEAAVREADEWLNTHRVNDTWRVMNRLRDTLVRVAEQSPMARHSSKTV